MCVCLPPCSHKKTTMEERAGPDAIPCTECRTLAIRLTVFLGRLSALVLEKWGSDSVESSVVADCAFKTTIVSLVHTLFQLCRSSRLDMVLCIRDKIELNKKKYPSTLCKVSWVGDGPTGGLFCHAATYLSTSFLLGKNREIHRIQWKHRHNQGIWSTIG